MFNLFRYYNLLPCPLCKRGDGDGANRFCADCLKELPKAPSPACPGCGGELDGALASCSICLGATARPWAGAVTLFEYRDLARKMLHDFKFHNFPELARPLGELAAAKVKEAGFMPELAVPIPLHWTRLWGRSYNQAGLFAAETARNLGIPCREALRRRKRGKRQASLGQKARSTNPKGAFEARSPEPLAGKRILLVDDIFTTGATLDAAAKTLLAAGSGPVWILTIARTPRYSR